MVRHWRLGAAIALGGLALGLTFASYSAASGAGTASSRTGNPLKPRAIPAPHITIAPADQAQNVALDTPVVVTADSGYLSTVTILEAGSSSPPSGQLARDDLSWQLTDGLDAGASYSIQAAATNGAGQTVSTHATFRTLSAQGRLLTTFSPGDGSTVGVGQPIDLSFNAPIPDDRKAPLLQRIQVTSKPGVLGAWHWYSDSSVHFRTQDYWPSGTQVMLTANLKGFDAGNGVWGLANWSMSFTVGPKHVSVIDDATHLMQVYQSDRLIDTWPVSLGKPGFPTLSGTLVVLYKQYDVRMKSCATFGTRAACVPGGANYYDQDVFYDTAVSSSGYFIHAAPWSVYAQGRYDVSHGCINLSTARATTFFNWSQPGDVVIIQHTSYVANITDGEADWQIDFSQFSNTNGFDAFWTAPQKVRSMGGQAT